MRKTAHAMRRCSRDKRGRPLSAEEKAESDNVRAFAKEMIDAHQKCIDSLERFAHNHHRDRASREPGASRKRGVAAAATVAAEPEPAKASPGADEPRGATTAQAGEHHEHFSKYMKIREELADQCRASVKRELDTTDGREFDECFMGLQVGYHMLLVDELTVLIRHGSPELKPVLQQDLVQAQKHFDKAKQILISEVKLAEKTDESQAEARLDEVLAS